MEIQVPSDILENSEAALALFAAIICIAGMALCAVAYIAFFMAMQNADSAISPQFDSAYALVSDTQAILISASNSTQSLSDALSYMSNATGSYSTSASGISDSLSGLAKVPPFSLDTKFASAVAGVKNASAYFASASSSMNASAASAVGISASLEQATYDLGQAAQSISAAKASFKGAILALDAAALFACIAMAAFFSSVILVSVSILLSHYPRLFGAKGARQETSLQQGQGRTAPGGAGQIRPVPPAKTQPAKK